ncbi:hypothetical protein ACFY0N_36840 [Streptomyces vinaceus]|uniref:hypothetical protein n=1 Tax=Streptomyces vinaceus TaxID=1960 RepID=UPI0035DAECB8
MLEEIHPDGDSSCYQEKWFGAPATWPLWAADEPRRVELSNNDCDTGCCGGVFVTIQRCGDLVEWMNWENTNGNRVPVPPEIHFDTAQYDDERWDCRPFPHGIRVHQRDPSAEVFMPFMTNGSGGPVEDQVHRFVEQITATDPRESAKGP